MRRLIKPSAANSTKDTARLQKRKMGKEIAVLLLPILLIGGVAWLRMGQKTPLLPLLTHSNPFNSGPFRLEYAQLNPTEVTPYDAWRGYDWSAKTQVWEAGTWDVPKTWRENGLANIGYVRNFRVIYRKGQTWKPVSSPKNVSVNLLKGIPEITFRANLKGIPPDAEEVRLRGQFFQYHMYWGKIPPRWQPPKAMKLGKHNHIYTVESKPFDVQIKAPNEPIPTANTSREATLEVVEGKWLHDDSLTPAEWQRDVMVVRLRRKDGTPFGNPLRLITQNIELFDAKGKRLHTKDYQGKPWQLELWLGAQNWFSYKRSPNELFAVFTTGQNQPSGGWDGIAAPLRLRAKISDGDSWPQNIDVKIEQVSMRASDYGAAY